MGLFSSAQHYFSRKDSQGYPLDLDGSLRYTRPYVIDTYPWPTRVGMVQGFMKEMNAFVWNTGYAKTPSGPNVNQFPSYAEYQIAVAGLSKFPAKAP